LLKQHVLGASCERVTESNGSEQKRFGAAEKKKWLSAAKT